jgi:23S rRNA pseudouridine2605 synthase
MERERVQKVLARAGIGSRRHCEELIEDGLVTINGELATLGDKVDVEVDAIEVDGVPVGVAPGLVYYLLNKPAGVVTTAADTHGRRTVVDLVPPEPRVFPVGRLDQDSEGLLLLTNDGDLTNKLTHPSYSVPKTYLAEVTNGPLPRNVGRQLLAGVELEDGPAKVDTFRLVDAIGKTAQIEITLHEGRKHIVRRMLDAVGHPVTRLIRTSVGPVKLGNLRTGGFRHLSNAEVSALFKAAGD